MRQASSLSARLYFFIFVLLAIFPAWAQDQNSESTSLHVQTGMHHIAQSVAFSPDGLSLAGSPVLSNRLPCSTSIAATRSYFRAMILFAMFVRAVPINFTGAEVSMYVSGA